MDVHESLGEEHRHTLEAIEQLRRRQDDADRRDESLQHELAGVREGLAEVRDAIEELRRQAALAGDADSGREPVNGLVVMHETRLEEVDRELAATREFREDVERELDSLRMRDGEVVETVAELIAMTARLSATLETRSSPVGHEQSTHRSTVESEPIDSTGESGTIESTGESEPIESTGESGTIESTEGSELIESSGESEPIESTEEPEGLVTAPDQPAVEAPDQAPAPEMDAAEPELEASAEPAVQLPPEGAAVLSLSPLTVPERRSSWLAPAIRRVAGRSPALAGELIAELAAFHGRIVEGPLAYELRIKEFGALVVRTEAGCATVGTTVGYGSGLDFVLEGRAAAFASLAGGGAAWRAGRLRVRGSRRRARRLLAACRRPLALADLVEADISVCPGPLLLAVAEAVDPVWTVGNDFTVAYVIQGSAETVYVRVRDGASIAVSAQLGDGDQPAATVYVSERALLRVVAGFAPLPDEPALFSGDRGPVELLRGWFARAQGLAAAS